MSTVPERSEVELVASFADRDRFLAAVQALLAAGFTRDDLSVLDSHDPLVAAEAQAPTWQARLAATAGEVKYIGPLAAAGFVAIATGPVGVAIAGLVGAGVAGLALEELLEDLMVKDKAKSFARALEEGQALLWVRVGESADAADRARAVLEAHGGQGVHRSTRYHPA